MCLRYKIQNLITSLKWRFQRFKKGYADIDVWNFNDWFLETIPKMLMELKEELNGYPIDMKPEDWEKYLQEMINPFEIAYTIDDVDYDYPEDYKYLSESEKELITEKYMEHIKYCKKELHDGLKMLDERFFDLWD